MTLMHDLIGAYERLDRLYRLYIKSAFPLRSTVLADERDERLRGQEVLSQQPLVETIPIYESSNMDLDAAVRELPSEYAGLAKLGQNLLPEGAPLYKHQWQSLHEVLLNGKDIVVT